MRVEADLPGTQPSQATRVSPNERHGLGLADADPVIPPRVHRAVFESARGAAAAFGSSLSTDAKGSQVKLRQPVSVQQVAETAVGR